MRHAATAALVALAAFAFGARADAQENRAPRRAAEMLFKEGLKAVDKGDYKQAYDDFMKAYPLYPRGSVALSIGLTDVNLGRPVEALHYLRLALAATDLNDRERAIARHKMDEASAQTGHVHVMAPDGATVRVDGNPSGTAPLGEDVDVMPGKHVVEAQADQREAQVEVMAKPGAVVVANLGWSSQAPVETPQPSPTLPADQPAPHPASPSTATPPPPRREQSNANASGHATARTIVAGALGVAALGALGAAIYFGAHSSGESDTAASLRAQAGSSRCPGAGSLCTSLGDAVDAKDRDATLQRVFYGVAGAAAIGAVAVWLLWRPAQGSTSAWIAPWAAEGTAGIAAGAGF